MNSLISLQPGIAEALGAKRPVVAIETTSLAQGLPHPHNVETLRRITAAMAAEDAVAAPVAVIGGRIVVGVEDGELEHLLAAGDMRKASIRDLAPAILAKRNGATTVAVAMAAAHEAGIRIVSTGGIGGVHYRAGETFDISADLTELGRTPVAVMCSGPKASIDISKTLEVLETNGVPLIGYGVESLPGFFSVESEWQVDQSVDGPGAAAELLRIQWDLGLSRGVVIANPPPAEHALSWQRVKELVRIAMNAADAQSVKSSDLTPYILHRLIHFSEEETLKCNMALLESNARAAAKIAHALVDIEKSTP